MSHHEEHLLQLLPLFQQVLTRVGIHQTRTGHRLGITNLQMSALGSVASHDDCMMRELAEDMLVSLPAATRIVNDLVEKSLIERIADNKDRRVVRLRITQPGLATMKTVHEEATALLGTILEKMSKEELDALIVGLDSFINAVIEVEEDA